MFLKVTHNGIEKFREHLLDHNEENIQECFRNVVQEYLNKFPGCVITIGNEEFLMSMTWRN